MEFVQQLKAIADENRLKILQLIGTEELCGCEILQAFSFTQPTLSHHMKVLCDANLVCCTKAGKWCRYKVNESNVHALLAFLHETLGEGVSK